MSQWAEIRHMHLVDEVPKKEIARRLGLDIKTVRRAIERVAAPIKRQSPLRGRILDPWREEIEALLRDEPRITAKRIATLLREKVGPVRNRTVRKYVADLRRRVQARECFVHRTHRPGDTMEADFGESWAVIDGALRKVKYLVVTLPASNSYFAKAYPAERLECLLDGILEAFRWFGGMPRRVVLDNTSLAVRKVLQGTERLETRIFEAFRGAFPFHADFCAPAKGNEKGSVERGVEYVRANSFVPRPAVASFDTLNEAILAELDRDLDYRKLPDGRTARQALTAEREHLRPLPPYCPPTCRVLTCIADKFAHIRVDRSIYSIPSRHARRTVTVNLFHDRVEASVDGVVVAEHERSFTEGKQVFDHRHVLGLLERKHRAIDESTAIQQWELPEVFSELREQLRGVVNKSDQEWIRVLRLTEEFAQSEVEEATRVALERSSPRLATIEMILRRDRRGTVVYEPIELSRPEWAGVTVAEPTLVAWDDLWEVRT